MVYYTEVDFFYSKIKKKLKGQRSLDWKSINSIKFPNGIAQYCEKSISQLFDQLKICWQQCIQNSKEYFECDMPNSFLDKHKSLYLQSSGI